MRSHQTDNISAYRMSGDEFVIIVKQVYADDIEKLVISDVKPSEKMFCEDV